MTFFEPVGERVHNNPEDSSCLNTDSLFRQSVWSLYLHLGSMGLYFDFIKILLGEEVCSEALGSRSLKLQASWSLLQHQSPNKRFTCFPLLAQKALWHSSNLRFLLCFIFDNPLPVRILAGSYNGMYFQGSHFMTRKVGSVFPGGC